MSALLDYGPLREAFEQRPTLTLTLHITGPVPAEHRADLERVLDAYEATLAGLPEAIARRLFLALSVGFRSNPSHDGVLDIVDIYQLADLVVFPSLTEGRGLPIPESAAAGIPIVCSPYDPRVVFDQVVGANLPADLQIRHAEFPEGDFSDELLARLTVVLLRPESQAALISHNREATKRRYSFAALQSSLAEILEQLATAVGD